MSEASRRERRFLFLQGMASQFFGRLGPALQARGHVVRRINFNAGDRLFWPLPGAADYRGGLEGWPGYLRRKLDAWAITDIVLFGDCRPLHTVARRLADARGLRVHVVEEGYLRPNWITVELGGVNGCSGLLRDGAWYRRAAEDIPPWTGGRPVAGRFSRRAVEDVAYNLATVFGGLAYPGYRTHRPWHPFVEYAGWLKRFATGARDRRRTAAKLQALAADGGPFYLFPLQLDCDSQIRSHSPFRRLAPGIEHVLASFARAAPPETLLVVKEHPLDNRLSDWGRLTREIAAREGVADRVIYLEDGPLEPMIGRARGVVTVNSTVGIVALGYGLPTIALGVAIYDLPELTFQHGLDRFWTEGQPPCAETFDAFRRVVAHRTQVNGGFFSEEGLALAVEGAVARLESDQPLAAARPALGGHQALDEAGALAKAS